MGGRVTLSPGSAGASGQDAMLALEGHGVKPLSALQVFRPGPGDKVAVKEIWDE
jgi:hypothetical protein